MLPKVDAFLSFVPCNAIQTVSHRCPVPCLLRHRRKSERLVTIRSSTYLKIKRRRIVRHGWRISPHNIVPKGIQPRQDKGDLCPSFVPCNALWDVSQHRYLVRCLLPHRRHGERTVPIRRIMYFRTHPGGRARNGWRTSPLNIVTERRRPMCQDNKSDASPSFVPSNAIRTVSHRCPVLCLLRHQRNAERPVTIRRSTYLRTSRVGIARHGWRKSPHNIAPKEIRPNKDKGDAWPFFVHGNAILDVSQLLLVWFLLRHPVLHPRYLPARHPVSIPVTHPVSHRVPCRALVPV